MIDGSVWLGPTGSTTITLPSVKDHRFRGYGLVGVGYGLRRELGCLIDDRKQELGSVEGGNTVAECDDDVVADCFGVNDAESA